MKLSVEFDADDFSSMLVGFFKDAGYDIIPSSLVDARDIFIAAFPNGVLALSVLPAKTVMPTETEITDTYVSNADAPINTVDMRGIQLPPKEDAILPFSKVMDPEYQEVAELQSILNLSKTLEKTSK